MAGPLGGGARDPRAPTINAKNIDGGPPTPKGGSGLHPRFERCVVNLHGYDKQKSNFAHGSHSSAIGPIMVNDPWSIYRAWVIQCDTI
jgi:hypothetical protein